MKSFQERNPLVIGAIGLALTAGVMVAAVQYDKLPFLTSGKEYSAYFAEAGGLRSASKVRVSGLDVGSVGSIELDGPRVMVTFEINEDIPLGDRTEATIKLDSALGSKVLDLTPRGDGKLSGAIPLDRTTSAYQLPEAIGDLTAAISGLNTDQLSDSLAVLSETFRDTPPDVKAAVDGLGKFSQTLSERDAQLRSLLSNAEKSTAVLAERSDQIVSLVRDTNALLIALQSQSDALDQISANISVLALELKGFIDENRAQLRPTLDKLNGVLTIVDNHREQVKAALKGLNTYALGLGESVGSGPFFKAYVANLFPGQFVQPFIDVAFSDLGLDPNVLAPTEFSDPQVGQPGTPALPSPFPRTGQGGDPILTIPDAITGNPNDPRYPPTGPILPAPPPGGPPPGPPAEAAPDRADTPIPPLQISEPAPGEAPQPAAPETFPPGPPTVGPGAPGPTGEPPYPAVPPGYVPPPEPARPPPPPEGGQ